MSNFSMSLGSLLLATWVVAFLVGIVSPGAAFATSPGFGQGFRLRGAESRTKDASASRGLSSASRSSARFSNQDTSALSSNAVWLSMVAALAGATLSARHRSCAQSRAALTPEAEERKRRFRLLATEKYGGKNKPRTQKRHVATYGSGSIKAPRWLPGWKPTSAEEEGMSPKESKNLFDTQKCPSWLNFDFWQSISGTRSDKTRSVAWFKRRFDNKGKVRFDRKQDYTIPQALQLIIDMYTDSPSGIDPTMECIMQLNLDQKFPDQQIRANITLPNGSGKGIRVAVFCTPDEEEEALSFGAAIAGKTLMDEINAEEFNFDVLIAKPTMMPALARLGKILGPRKLMPSPKAGTVVQDLELAVKEWSSGGSIQMRSNNFDSMIMCAFGKLSMGKDQLVENFRAVLQGTAANAPTGAKKDEPLWLYVKMGSTQSPSIKIAASEWPGNLGTGQTRA